MKKLLTLFTALILFGSMTMKAQDTWTPAGTPASVFGEEWNPELTANDMTLSNGLYVFAKQSDFSATSIEFKVCKNHGWGTAYPGSNYGFTIPNGSKYLIITYNPSGNNVNAIAISSMTVAGDNATLFGNTWTPSAAANDMTLQSEGTYKFEKTGVALSAGTVSFKACANHGWDNAWPSANYELSIPESGNYTITITFNPATLSVSATATLEEAVVVIPTIAMHGNFTGSWADTENFTLAGDEKTASLTLTGVTKGTHNFGMKIDGSWTANASAFTRDDNSYAITGDGDDCTFDADRNGDYTFTWTFASNTLEIGYPAIPAQSVELTGLASQILKGVEVTFTASSAGIDEPVYRYYVKAKNGEYGSAIEGNTYIFDAIGEYKVKVEALEYGNTVAFDESEVVIYDTHTFASGTTIYVDFSAVDALGDEMKKGVNYPKANEVGIDYDAAGAGTVKTVTFTTDVTWTTMADAFIKTAKADWAKLKFTVPGNGNNCAVVAADGASYSWTTILPPHPTVEIKGSWDEWATASELEGNVTSVSVTKHLAKGDHEFKLIVGGDWRGNGYTYHRDYTGASGITEDGDNMVIEADVEGDYTFTWTFADNAINITFQECDYYIKNNWYGCGAWKWKGMTKEGDKYRIDNVVYGGNGLNYNTSNSDEGAVWKEASTIKYADNKVVAAYDTVNFILDPAAGTITAESISKDVTVYTVASNSLALCDLGWAPTHPHKYTDMKKQEDGTYKWTCGDDEIVLVAGNVYIKVIKDRDYENGYWPTTEEGLECVIPQSGIYTVEVNFNPCTHDITFTPTLKKALNIKNLVLKGSWGTQALVLNGNNDKALVTLPLTVGTHSFQLLDGGTNKYGNGQEFTRDHNSYRDIIPESGSDMSIEVDKAGEYLFTYIYESKQLLVYYPAIVPEDKIAPLDGEFTINAQKETVRFARGNLQYNYGTQTWYAAEKQYEVLSDLNLRFGDDEDENPYQGSVDVFGWSCTSSNFGLLKSNLDADFTGSFVDWGAKFEDDEKVWSSLTRAEWDYLLSRTKGGQKLWTIIALGPDSLRGITLFPDDWTAPAGLTIKYGFFDLDEEEDLKANSFTFAQWQQMEDAGAVFLPLAGARAGYVGNELDINGNKTSTKNPLSGWYCWMDNVSEYGFYWLATNPAGKPKEADMLVGPWLNGDQTQYTRPVTTTRPRRYGHAVRLVTRCPNFDYQRDGLTLGRVGTLCIDHNVEVGDIYGGTFYQIAGKTEAGNIVFDEVTSLNAGEPYIYQATASTIGVYYGSISVASPVPVKGMYGSFEDFNLAIDEGNKLNILYIAGNKIHDCSDIATLQVVANRCYIKLDEVPVASPNVAPGRRRITLGRDEATGLFDLNTSDAPRKLLINGTIYILRGENVYDATGRLVK